MELSDAVKDYINKKMTALNKFYGDKIIRATVVVGIDSRHHMKGKKFFAESRLEIAGNDVFASKFEETLYKAIDKIRDYLELELNKHKLKHGVKAKDKKIGRLEKEYKMEI